MNDIKPAILMTVLFTILTGVVFPFFIYGVSQVLFHDQAQGSFVTDAKGTLVGSRLIGQNFTLPKYFHPRPSAAGSGYDAAGTSGTNLGPISAKLVQGIKDDPTTDYADETFNGFSDLAKAYREENQLSSDILLPSDAITRSGSGIDPEISPANALLQADRVSKARGIPIQKVKQLISEHTESRFLGIFGEPRVNVLMINLALDKGNTVQ